MFDKPGGRFLPAAPAEPSPRAASPATRLGTEPGSIRRALRFATERILARERVVVAAQPAAVPKAASPAEFVKRRCEEAAAKQAREPAIVRTTLTGEHINAAQAFVEWSARAGMHARIVDVRCDPATGEAVAEVDTPATALKLAAGGSDTRVACCRPPAAARPLPPVPDAREYSPDEPSPDALSPETVAVTIDGGGPPPASFASACSKSPPRRANPPPTAAGSDAGGDEASCDSPIPAFARGGSETPVASRGCYSAGAGSENLGQAKSASVASHGARRGPAEPRLYPTLEPDPCMNRTADTDESLWRDDSSLQLADLDSRRHGATAEQRLGSVRPAAVVMSPLRHQADEEKDERHPKQNPDPAFSSVASSASASGFYTAPSGHSKVTDDRFSVPRVAPDPSRESCGTLHSAPEAREASVSGGSNWCDQRTVSERLAISLKQQQAQKHSPCRAEAAEGGRRAEASRLNPLHEQAPARLAGWLEDHNRPRQVTAGNHPASIMGGELSRM
ncbi:hypothetical protein DIPPA_30995 [Diplonema papillatum]|nr:hypothetical protein DIPPA_30995 [Diplonema papillatum]